MHKIAVDMAGLQGLHFLNKEKKDVYISLPLCTSSDVRIVRPRFLKP